MTLSAHKLIAHLASYVNISRSSCWVRIFMHSVAMQVQHPLKDRLLHLGHLVQSTIFHPKIEMKGHEEEDPIVACALKVFFEGFILTKKVP